MNERVFRLAVAVTLALFFWKAFIPGWTQQTTDFPNYYTAARLVRQRVPLRRYYDWNWFQRQIGRAGIEGQLGGYIPQTPLTMLPFVPLSGMAPLTAKRCWLLANLLFLALSIQLLSRMTRFSRAWLWLLIFAFWQPLRANFLLGQYYVFLLLLFTLAAYTLERRHDASSGVFAGLIFGLKLYAAPLSLCFVAQRRWRAVAGMSLSAGACISFAAILFGWRDVSWFTTQVLPRALQGETLNPFHPANSSFSTLLRATFVTEPGLNPNPPFHSAAAFFFFQPLLTLTVIALPLIAGGSFAWFLIALLLASPNTASYTFVLLALPAAILLRDLPRRHWVWLLLPCIAIGLPMPAAWTWAFPKLWLLLAIYIAASQPHWRTVRSRTAIVAAATVILTSAASAMWRMHTYADEPRRKYEAVVSSGDAVYSAFPAAIPAGTVYQSIAEGHYLLRRIRDNTTETFAFSGQAFTPSVPGNGTPFYFELASGGASRIASFDPDSGRTRLPSLSTPDPRQPAVSHDGKLLVFVSGGALYLFDGVAARMLVTPRPAADPSFLPGDRGIVFVVQSPDDSRICVFDPDAADIRVIATTGGLASRPSISPDGARLLFASTETGQSQIWTTDLTTGKASKLTGGACNNSTPAWGSAPDEILFASDCGRGLGLPAIYRIDHIANLIPKTLDPEAALPLPPARGR